MKQKLAIIGLVSLTITGCGQLEAAPESPEGEQTTSGFSISPDDVVNEHGEITNMVELEAFMTNVETGEPDSIRVVTYTVEGDPILLDLAYDGEQIKATSDSTRDEYGSGSVKTTTCDNIGINETPEFTEYVLEGCEGGDFDTTVLVQ